MASVTEAYLTLHNRFLLCHIEFQADLLIKFQLHDQERIPSLTLAQRRVKTKHDKCVSVVILREQEELFDGRVLDLVVVGLAAESEG